MCIIKKRINYWLIKIIIVKLICSFGMEQYSSGWRGAPAKGVSMAKWVYMEWYSRGWRGVPAKDVERVSVARVQIPLTPPF